MITSLPFEQSTTALINEGTSTVSTSFTSSPPVCEVSFVEVVRAFIGCIVCFDFENDDCIFVNIFLLVIFLSWSS